MNVQLPPLFKALDTKCNLAFIQRKSYYLYTLDNVLEDFIKTVANISNFSSIINFFVKS